MRRKMRRASTLLALVFAFAGATGAAGAPACKPALTVRGVTFSPIHQAKRTWTAHVAVDASRCASASGRFDIAFVRLKEDAPDLPFTESFDWKAGRSDVTTDFAADEAVASYRIELPACPCRE